ncbi:NAD-binding protein [Roseibium alexandrii]
MSAKSPRLIIILLVAIGFVCGFSGLLMRNLAEAGTIYEHMAAVLDAFHQTILLIAPDSHYADLPGPQDTWLSGLLLIIGRLLLPFGVIVALIGSLQRLWLPGWLSARARWQRGHVLVAGLGDRGQSFAKGALAGGLPVSTLSTADPGRLGQRHIPLLLDASNFRSWEAVAIKRAKSVVVALPNDASNLAALSALMKSLQRLSALWARGNEPLTIHVALEDAQTRQAFLDNEAALKPFAGCEVRPYSVSELIARRFFQEVSLHANARRQEQARLHLVFAGRGPVNQALLLQFLKIAPAWNFDRPKLTLVSDAPEKWQEELENDYPGIETLADFEVVSWPESHAHPSDADLARSEQAGDPVTAIFVDQGESEHNAVAARLLRSFCRREATWRAPIYFQARRGANLAHFFDETGDEIADPILPLSSIENVCSLSAIDGTDDVKAQQIHSAYLQSERGQDGAASLPWEQLAETFRAASRRAADYLTVCDESLLAFQQVQSDKDRSSRDKEADVSDLKTTLEHASWCNERVLKGWRYGSQRDNGRLLHPEIPIM